MIPQANTRSAGAAAAAPANHETSAGAAAAAPADVALLQCQVEGRSERALSVVRRAFVRQVRTLGMSYTAVPGLPYDEGGPLR